MSFLSAALIVHWRSQPSRGCSRRGLAWPPVSQRLKRDFNVLYRLSLPDRTCILVTILGLRLYRPASDQASDPRV